MKLRINWRYCLLIIVDVLILVYLVFAMTSWNKPDEVNKVCTKVEINIEDENENGFLKTAEVKTLLESRSLYPLSKKVSEINTRDIENTLLQTAFVKNAECYVTNEGYAYISLTQRTPLMRVKASNGSDFYIDDNGGIMPNSQYTSDMIIVTGNFNKNFACKKLSILAKIIMDDDFWRNQVEQINVQPDKTIELIPRVGEHIINIGELPNTKDATKLNEEVSEFVKNQLHRMELFYKYGLKEAGWNKYDYISLEYSNQVICTRKGSARKAPEIPVVLSVTPKNPTENKPNQGALNTNSPANNANSETQKTASETEKPATSQSQNVVPKQNPKPTASTNNAAKNNSTPANQATNKKIQ